LAPQPVEFNKPVNRPQQVSFRHMPFQRKLAKQRVLLNLPFPHHRLPPSRRDARLYCIHHAVFQQNRARAIIPPSVSTGDALIGAGSVVTRDVPAGATAIGNPARVRAATDG
jgi:hypothetical protein